MLFFAVGPAGFLELALLEAPDSTVDQCEQVIAPFKLKGLALTPWFTFPVVEQLFTAFLNVLSYRMHVALS